MSEPERKSEPERDRELPSGLSLGWADPDDQPDDGRLWLRWPPGEVCNVSILSDAPLFYPGHWLPATRSYRLCTYPTCQFCASGDLGGGRTRRMASERRIRHLVVVRVRDGRGEPVQRIWEFGGAVAEQLQTITGFQRAGGGVTRQTELRGLSLGLCREGSRQSGAVLVAAAPGTPWPEYLPEPLDMAGHLAASWRRAALRDGKGQPRLPVGF